VPRLGFERQVAQFIDDQQFRLAVLRQPCLKRPLLLPLSPATRAAPSPW
jgi:hypothetical protein